MTSAGSVASYSPIENTFCTQCYELRFIEREPRHCQANGVLGGGEEWKLDREESSYPIAIRRRDGRKSGETNRGYLGPRPAVMIHDRSPYRCICIKPVAGN